MTTTTLPPFTHGVLSTVFGSVRELAQQQSRLALCAGINHLLKLEPNVHALLKAHTSRQLVLRWPAKNLLPAGELAIRINQDALLEPIQAHSTPNPDVTVTLLEGFIAAASQERLRFVRIEGDALLAQALGLVAQRLRWDAEHDLARYVGDVPAVWLVANAKSAANAIVQASQRLMSNVSDYAQYEANVFVRRDAMDTHTADIAQLAKRIAQLELKLRPKPAPNSHTPL